MRFKQFLFCVSLSLFSVAATAVPIQIAATPTETSGPFRHNAFHTATTNGGQSGGILGWFNLGAGGGSWDPDTGVFVINIDVFSDSGLTSNIGSAIGTGNLTAGAFNGFDGGVLGSITWNFNTTNAALVSNTTTSFIDHNYATSNAGYNANSLTGTAPDYTALTLWGADGTPVVSLDTGVETGNFTGNTLGVDLVVTFVPVPAAVWLFGSGLLGLVAVSRRRG